MRVLRCSAAALLVLGLAAVVSASDPQDQLLEELTEIGDKLAAAMLENDIDTMLAMYTEDAISLPNFSPRMQGTEAFRQHNEQMTAMGMKVHSFESDPTEAWEAGDHVIEIGTYEIKLEMPGMPSAIEDKGKYMTVYVRADDGSLKIKAETWNTDMNPMQMGGMGGDHGHGDGP